MRRAIVAGSLCGFVLVGLYGVRLGWGTDRDSVRVLQAAASILAGHYQRSRSFGFPLHEAATAMLLAWGGLTAANFGSLCVTLAGIGVGLRIAGKLAPERVAPVAVTLCGAPLLLVDASSAIDFGWSFASGMFLLATALWLARTDENFVLAPFGLAIFVCLLLRPDNLLFVVAAVMAMVWPYAPRRGRIVAVAMGAAVLAGGVYIALNGFDILVSGIWSTRPGWARLARAVVLGSAAVGPGGMLALGWLAAGAANPAPVERFFRRVVALSWLLYVPRFVALPDQADYLILPVMCSLLLAVCVLPWRVAVACAALSALPAWLTISMLWRDPADGSLRVRVAPQWGAVVQDWAARRFAMDMARPEMTALVASRLSGAGAPAVLTYDTYMPGFVSPAHDLVIGQGHLYSVAGNGQDIGRAGTVPRRWYGAIWACDAALGPGIGWRAWEAPVAEAVTPGLKCWRTNK